MEQRLLKKACAPVVALNVIIIAMCVVVIAMTVMTYFNMAHGAEPGTCLFTGKIINNCMEEPNAEGKEPNVLVQWTMPTSRELCLEYNQTQVDALKAAVTDGSFVNISSACVSWEPLALEEIDFIRVYTVTTLDVWIPVDVFNHRTAVTFYRDPGTYEIMATTVDTGGRESLPSPRVTTVLMTPPKQPQGLTITAP